MKTYLYPKLLAVLIVFLCIWQGNATMLTAQQTKAKHTQTGERLTEGICSKI